MTGGTEPPGPSDPSAEPLDEPSEDGSWEAAEDQWFDDEAGPVVRLFSMTGGRARPVGDEVFDLIAMVTARDPAEVEPALPAPALQHEHHALLELCDGVPLSVAELGSFTDLPVSVVRVLLGDLHDAGLIDVTRPVAPADLPDERLLRDVINGLRAL